MMFCGKCGSSIDGHNYCPNCGTPCNVPSPSNASTNPCPQRKCPKCGSTDFELAVYSDTKSHGKDFSVGQGCLGYLLFGPLGILCGLCGQGKTTTTTHETYHVCKHCGNKIRQRDELLHEIEDHKKNARNGLIACGIISILLIILGLIVMTESSTLGLALIFPALILVPISVINSLIHVAQANKKSDQLDESWAK